MNIEKKMMDLAKKLKGRYWISEKDSPMVSKIKEDTLYDIRYYKNKFIIFNTITEKSTVIKKRNAVVVFFASCAAPIKSI